MPFFPMFVVDVGTHQAGAGRLFASEITGRLLKLRWPALDITVFCRMLMKGVVS